MIDSWSICLSPSPSSASSSTRSSHLSVLSSSSSVSSPTSLPSPLPSPSPSISSIDSKTHAFFGSPFGGEGSPTPLPPPNPRTRSISIRSHNSNTSDDVFDETPKAEQKGPLRSLNADFFGPSLLPTPPPSTPAFPRSAFASRDSSPASKPTLPPLSRFFPSRRRYHDPEEAQSPPSRGFLQLDTAPPPHAYRCSPWLSEQYAASPVDDRIYQQPSPIASPIEAPTNSSALATPVPKYDEPSYATPSKTHAAQDAHSDVQPGSPTLLEPGAVIGGPELELELVRTLGQGAFSSVWLARDVKGELGKFELSRKTSLLRSKSLKRGRARQVEGLRPKRKIEENGAKREVHVRKEPVMGRLVAVKTTERSLCERNSRTRVSFVREVEILRHISHPSIVSYLHSFSTPSHHCLVLEYVGGGELFDLIDNPESHARLTEPLLRRMFGELCKAVGWMHGVDLVHRDIKLENILLTASPFTDPLPTTPLIKLSDFGLSRFIDPAQPMLTTLCGSESYAAPELVTGRPYDGRETDAWACGVVLYALATRRLPFDLQKAHAHRELVVGKARTREAERSERRALLMRIAKCDYSWPPDGQDECPDVHADGRETQLVGPALAHSAGIRRVVRRLLIRDPRKRSKIIDVWEDEWMHGAGAPPAPPSPTSPAVEIKPEELPDSAQLDSQPNAEEEDPCAEVDADEDGILVDSHDIVPGSVAHQEH